MGYCMSCLEIRFCIKKRNKAKALAGIKDLATQTHKGHAGSWSGGKQLTRGFSWVTTEDFVNAKTLKEALDAWGWQIDEDDTGDVTHIYFDRDKIGDEDILFEAIASAVEDGSYIQMAGEDGTVWRWYFNKGKCYNQEATQDYEDSANILSKIIATFNKTNQLPLLIGLHPTLDSKIEKLMKDKQ